MEHTQIIEQANKLIKGATFTKLLKPSKNYGHLFLIVTNGDGSAIYGACTKEIYFAFVKNELFRLSY
jgi:hypothetical protein